jgi:staphylococcal nuclease domain-containing protein 1
LQISLSGLSAPRISRHSEQKDDPYGFASREFLRKIIIGRQVKFRGDYKLGSGPQTRLFATVWVATPLPGINGNPGMMGVSPDAPSVNVTLAAMGTCRIEGVARLSPTEADALSVATKSAEEKKFGLFGLKAGTTEGSMRSILWNPNAEHLQSLFVSSTAENPMIVNAIIEQVISGSTLRCYLPEYQIMGTVTLAAIQCPKTTIATSTSTTSSTSTTTPLSSSGGKTNSTASSNTPSVDPIGVEARLFTEMRLLQRDVRLRIGGIDKFGNLVCDIEHALGDISLDLVKNGLAKLADWSSTFTNAAHLGILRAAERSAKASKLKLWTSYDAPIKQVIPGARSFDGKVIEVLSGDSLVVLTNPDRPLSVAPDERRLSLSSLRAPRVGNARRNEPDAPFAFESKDALRRYLIGRKVHCDVEYTRTPVGTEGGAASLDRFFATITFQNRKGEDVDIASLMVGEGLCEVVRHKADEVRSVHYDELLAIEEAAKTAKKGIFSISTLKPKETTSKPLLTDKERAAQAAAAAAAAAIAHTTRRVADLSIDAQKAKNHFPFLQRAKVFRAIPEFVFSGGRVKVFIPSDNVYIVFGIAGVRCPQVSKRDAGVGPDSKPRPGRPAEPFGNEALAFMRENVLQQEVEIEAEDCDRNGVILGPMYIGKGATRRNIGTELIRLGLGSVVYQVVEKGAKDGEELVAAEKEAKEKKKGLWQFFVDLPPEDEDESTFLSSSVSSNAAASVSAPVSSSSSTIGKSVPIEMVGLSSGTIFAFVLETDRAMIDAVRGHMDALFREHGIRHAPLLGEPKKGDMIAALYDDGNGARWLRAKISGKHKVLPDEAPIPASEAGLSRWDVSFVDIGITGVITLTKMRPVSLPFSSYPPLSRTGTLALLRVPDLRADYGAEAAELLSQMTWGRPLLMVNHNGKDIEGRDLVELIDAETGVNMGLELVSQGLARVSRTEAKRARRGRSTEAELGYLKFLEEEQSQAKSGRIGMWKYGDVGDSDLEDSKPKQWGRK